MSLVQVRPVDSPKQVPFDRLKGRSKVALLAFDHPTYLKKGKLVRRSKGSRYRSTIKASGRKARCTFRPAAFPDTKNDRLLIFEILRLLAYFSILLCGSSWNHSSMYKMIWWNNFTSPIYVWILSKMNSSLKLVSSQKFPSFSPKPWFGQLSIQQCVDDKNKTFLTWILVYKFSSSSTNPNMAMLSNFF